ncbi:hypothetical protein CBOM_07561 [Ceraceosorus bombacis]|uniref:Uncharacterized protein n=1 Tax=Ceraceosorus bombacis TaxID=401625 RepID=A0A0N7L9S3_9BASI|nr:hypothetical protein CBOM_07561 [Ceraceosorus bombacis]
MCLGVHLRLCRGCTASSSSRALECALPLIIMTLFAGNGIHRTYNERARFTDLRFGSLQAHRVGTVPYSLRRPHGQPR